MIFTTSQTDQDLLQILELQQRNLASALLPDEIASQGFVTVAHRFEDLKKMNEVERHVIAKENDRVVAYVLAMTEKSKNDIPVLLPLFEIFNKITFRTKKISLYNYLVVGQVCVAKGFRGQGLFDACYTEYKKRFSHRYDFTITEISKKNIRSMKAHQRVGFETIHEYQDYNGIDWNIVVWDWL